MKKLRSSLKEKVENFPRSCTQQVADPDSRHMPITNTSFHVFLIPKALDSSHHQHPARQACLSSHHPLPPTLYRVSFQNYFQTPNQLTSPLAVSQPSTDLSRPLPTCSLRMSSRNFWTPLPRKIRGPRSFICPCISTSKNSNHAHQSSRKVSNLPTKLLFLWPRGPPLRSNRNVSNMREEFWVCFLSCCNPGI